MRQLLLAVGVASCPWRSSTGASPVPGFLHDVGAALDQYREPEEQQEAGGAQQEPFHPPPPLRRPAWSAPQPSVPISVPLAQPISASKVELQSVAYKT
jgi:hypothetical protein